MSEASHLVLMAEYNQLMNQRILSAAKELSHDSLMADKGAFFKSVFGTLNHILVGDIIWLKRLSEYAGFRMLLGDLDKINKPERLDSLLFDNLSELENQRVFLDKLIIKWVAQLSADDLDQNLAYSNMKGDQFNKRIGDLILHLFLHQIHHRGQVSTLLSQQKIDFGETDLIEIISDN